MPQKYYPANYELMDKLCKALNIDPATVQRIVIDVDASSTQPIRVYVQMVGGDSLVTFDWSAFLRDERPRRVPSPGPSETKYEVGVDYADPQPTGRGTLGDYWKSTPRAFDTPQSPDGGVVKSSPDEFPPGYEELL